MDLTTSEADSKLANLVHGTAPSTSGPSTSGPSTAPSTSAPSTAPSTAPDEEEAPPMPQREGKQHMVEEEEEEEEAPPMPQREGKHHMVEEEEEEEAPPMPQREGKLPNAYDKMTRSMENEKKFKVVFVLGAPGSGKSTQCQKIAQLYCCTHLRPLDLIQEMGSRSEYRTMIRKIMNGEKLLSELTVQLLRRAMHQAENFKFVIDGFPCDKENLDEWEKAMGIEPKLVLRFVCSEEVVVNRLKNNNHSNIRKRFDLFSKDSLSLIEHFNSIEMLKNIEAERSVEEVFGQIKGIFFQEAPDLKPDLDLDLSLCQESLAYEDYEDPEEEAQYIPQPRINKGKRRSESDLPNPTKKTKKLTVVSAQRRIKLALKELGLKHQDLTYLDGLTPDEYLKNLRDMVVVMARTLDNPSAPMAMKSLDFISPWDNKTILQMVEEGMTEVEETFFCADCKDFERAKIDWRVGYICLASYLLGTLFTVGLSPPSDDGFSVQCTLCGKKLVPGHGPVEDCNCLFLALTHSIVLFPKESILEYLRRQGIDISSDVSQDYLLFTFYCTIITRLDPTNVGWNYLRCPVAGAVSDGENA